MSDENTSTDTDVHWLDTFWSDAFIKDFSRRLVRGREENEAEQREWFGVEVEVEEILSKSEHPDQAALIKEDTPVVERALKLAAERHVFPKLHFPHPVTMEDILEIGVQQMAGVGLTEDKESKNEVFRRAFIRFMTHLEMAGGGGHEYVSESIDLGQWHQDETSAEGFWFSDVNGVVWQLDINQRQILDLREFDRNKTRSEVTVLLRAEGATQRAVDDAAERFRRPARSIAETVKLLATRSYQSDVDAENREL